MKHLVISDLHGRTVDGLQEVVDGEGINSLIGLGDFDQVRAIRSFMDLEEKFREEGKQTAVVPGNHDHAVSHNFPINSGTLMQQGKSIPGLHYELNQDPIAQNYISNLLGRERNGVEVSFGEDYPGYVVHGGLDGSLMSYYRCPEEWQDLWFRIDYNWDYPKNFKKMEEQGYKILVRGHDHHRMYGFEVEEGKSDSLSVGEGGKFELAESDKHVITSGAWFNGEYLIIDDSEERITLDFRGI